MFNHLKRRISYPTILLIVGVKTMFIIVFTRINIVATMIYIIFTKIGGIYCEVTKGDSEDSENSENFEDSEDSETSEFSESSEDSENSSSLKTLSFPITPSPPQI